MEYKKYYIKKDVVVAGGGVPGICAAVQAARLGLTVALINNRGYLGGNASPEGQVNINGSDGSQEFNLHSRATGIIGEIYLENLRRSPKNNSYILHTVLYDLVKREKNIELFLNTNIDVVEMKDDNTIDYISGSQSGTEKRFVFYANYFINDTGDGTVGYLAGADYRMGREAKEEFGERIAPDVADDKVLPCSLAFYAKDAGKPIKFIPPETSLDLSKYEIMKDRIIPKERFHHFQWYYSIGGDQISETQANLEKHWALAYGIWDHVKNSGLYNSENYEIEFMSGYVAKRESRRIMGDYILTEKDIVEQTHFDDNVGYGGWSIDLHASEGFFSKNEIINKHFMLKGVYDIPYRTLYSRNIRNLFLAGRCISLTHVALGSVRVIGTLGMLGQAAGVAAYLCKKYNVYPRDIYPQYVSELQQILLKNNMQIIGVKNCDSNDKALDAEIEVSSVKSLEILNMNDSVLLNNNVGISLPLYGDIKYISILLQADDNTEINYRVYVPEKIQNYFPENVALENKIKINRTAGYEWIKLPIALSVNNRFAFVEIDANDKVKLGVSNDILTGVSCHVKSINRAHNVYDIDTLAVRDFSWHKLNCNICFCVKSDQEVYGGENINNGYARPYGKPNLWISNDKVDGEYIIIKFKERAEVKEIIIRFDPNLNYRLLTSTGDYEFSAMPTIVKDYNIFYHDGEKYALLTKVRDNYLHENHIIVNQVQEVDKIITDKIKIEFKSTNGINRVGVYEVRIY